MRSMDHLIFNLAEARGIAMGAMNGKTYSPFKFLYALDVRPLIVVEEAGAIQQHITSFLEFSLGAIWSGLSECDPPLTLLFFPIATRHLSLECHKFAETKNLADPVQVFPDIG